MDIIELNDVFFSYEKNINVLDNINIKINQGEIIAVFGPNGAGKTTLLKILAGLYKPKGGGHIFNNLLSDKKMKFRYQSRFIPEGTFLPEFLTVIEFLRFTGTLYGLHGDELEIAIERVSSTFYLADHSQLIQNLSLGNKKRLQLASAFLILPKLLIFDEPFSGLDLDYREQFKDIMQQLKESMNIIIIFATHEPSTIDRLTDEILIIHNGRIKFRGNWREEKKKLEEEYDTIIRIIQDDEHKTLAESFIIDLEKNFPSLSYNHKGRIIFCKTRDEKENIRLKNFLSKKTNRVISTLNEVTIPEIFAYFTS